MATQAHHIPDQTTGRSAAASRAHLRRRRSLASVIAGVTLGAALTAASGLTGLIPGLGTGASAATVLSGKTFRDHNMNGVQDPPQPGDGPAVIENGVSPVTVTAYAPDGSVAGSAVTIADGSWSITTNAAGPFRVEFTNFPPKYTSGKRNAGSSVQFPTSGTVNFGLLAKVNGLGQIEDLTGIPVEIGDRVWKDLNANGIQDAGEPGIPGVEVKLIDAETGGLAQTATTTGDGIYSFPDLILFRNYRIEIAPGQAALAGLMLSPQFANSGPNSDIRDSNGALDATSGLVVAAAKTRGAGDNDHTFDFGFWEKKTPKLSLGDYVFLDNDGDGQQTAGDTPVQGATAMLLDGSGNPVADVATQTTGADGKYLFTNLDPGTYRVKFTRPTGSTVTPTTPNKGDDATDSDAIDNNDGSATTGPVTLVDKDDLTVDAGWVSPAKTYCLGDFVWDDVNRNGIQDAGEAGINGVTATVFAKGTTSPVLGTSTTAGTGAYKVCGLKNGEYDVVFSNIPAGKVVSPKGAGSDGTKDSDVDPTTSTASGTIADKDNLDVDLGLNTPVVPKAAIGDRVWLDANKDGLQSTDLTAEPGIAGARVTLLNADGSTVATTTTNSTGNYLFDGLDAGSYRVRFEAPAGQEGNFLRTAKDVGTNDAIDSDADVTTGETINYALAAGDRNLTVDSGWYPKPIDPVKLCVGDYVWNDTNNNGIQDAGETGVPGVRATLYNSAGQELLFTTTDSNGAWKICNLDPGTYSVVFTNIPSNTKFTTKNAAGSTTTNDSNADASGRTESFTLTTADDLTIDAGVVANVVNNATYCVGDFVWTDANNNGLQDAGEPGVAGVRATLFNAAGQELLFTTTDSKGAWKICGVVPGTYYVVFSNRPAGTSFTTQLVGTNPAINSDPDSTGRTPNFSVVNADVLTIDAGLITPTTIIVITPTTIPTTAPTVPPTTAAPTTAAPTTTPPTTVPGKQCLGDKVFRDPGNGANDGVGIAGVTLTLTKPDGSTQTTVTDSSGIYGFCVQTPGTYTVKVTSGLPAGANNTYDLDGNHDSATMVVLPAGTSNLDLDFGYAIPNVKGEVIPAGPATTPAFTGANTGRLALWAFALLLIGFGVFGLASARREETNWDGLW